MNNEKVAVNRTLVGVLALCCVVAAAAIWFYRVRSTVEPENAGLWQGAFTRVGLVMAALWLALPSGGRAPAWAHVSKTTLVGIIVVIFVLVRFRIPVLVLLPLCAGIAFFALIFRPRGKHRPRGRPPR